MIQYKYKNKDTLEEITNEKYYELVNNEIIVATSGELTEEDFEIVYFRYLSAEEKTQREKDRQKAEIQSEIETLKSRLATDDYKHIRQQRERALLNSGAINSLTMSENEYLQFCKEQAVITSWINKLENKENTEVL